MEIKRITGEYLEQYRHIISHSFERGMGCALTAEQLAETERFGVFEAGQLHASLRILDFQMFFGEERRPCGGIAGVACEPAARGRGYAGALLKHALGVMRERGQYLSSLWPFSFAYYQRYGWEWVGPGYQFKVPLELIPPQDEARYVEPLFENVPATLNPVYEKYAARFNGMVVRDAKRWESFEKVWGGRSHSVYVYRRDGEIEGYAKVKYREKEEEAEASEFAALTVRAYRGLLGVFRRYGMTVKNICWSGPLDDPLWSIVCNWDIEGRIQPQAMSRIVDAAAALGALRPDPGIRGSAVVSVRDEAAPWNSGSWRISVDSGAVEVRAESREPGVELDIQALSQAYWGSPSLDWLRNAGRIQVRDDSQLELLRRLLPPRTVLLLDDF